jgi:hypothetical protein
VFSFQDPLEGEWFSWLQSVADGARRRPEEPPPRVTHPLKFDGGYFI